LKRSLEITTKDYQLRMNTDKRGSETPGNRRAGAAMTWGRRRTDRSRFV
jgi:hypothetical protein